jgi:hypothetical protein
VCVCVGLFYVHQIYEHAYFWNSSFVNIQAVGVAATSAPRGGVLHIGLNVPSYSNQTALSVRISLLQPHIQKIKINNCLFVYCLGREGGAIYSEVAKLPYLDLTNTRFINNTCPSSTGILGSRPAVGYDIYHQSIYDDFPCFRDSYETDYNLLGLDGVCSTSLSSDGLESNRRIHCGIVNTLRPSTYNAEPFVVRTPEDCDSDVYFLYLILINFFFCRKSHLLIREGDVRKGLFCLLLLFICVPYMCIPSLPSIQAG